MSVRLILADDHRMLREALVELLSKEPDLEIAGEAGSAREALEQVERSHPDVLVLDIGLPDMSGVEVARRLRGAKTKVLVLSAYADKRFVQEAVKAGAAGYLSKGAAGSDLARAVRAVASGERYFSSEVAASFMRDLEPSDRNTPPPATVLAPREREVLKLIAEGARSPDIAVRLNIRVGTVETHRRNICRKLGLHTVAELTKYALREGLAVPY